MTTEEKIKEVLVESHGADPKELSANTNFRQLGLDSLELAEFILELEDIFGIPIPDDDVKHIFTIQDALKYAHSRSAAV